MEFVFVVPRNALFPDFYPHGYLPFSDAGSRSGRGPSADSHGLQRITFEATIEREGFFVERAHAEKRPELKQIIPYSIVECEGRLLLLRRLGTGGESRLHDKRSIGVGGHINPEDVECPANDRASRRNPVLAGTRREIEEELAVRGEYEIRPVGILNDDSNSVGAVHVGVVQVITIQGSVEIREKDQLEGRLVPAEELRRMLAEGENFETWSSLLIPRLDEILPKPLAVGS